MSDGSFDLAVVGGGIVGLAHAWTAAREGMRVALFERAPRAEGASIRNFGMIWPVGQPAGECHATALRSREHWLTASKGAGFHAAECGSIHLAHRADEWAVLEEFAALAPGLGFDVRLLSRDETLARSPAANPEGLIGGMWSPTELCVDPREATRSLAPWLVSAHGVATNFSTEIRRVESGRLESADGRTWSADRIVVCGGADIRALFPETLARPDLRLCKLQMMRTGAQPDGWRAGPHLASGLTLRHYHNFDVCASLAGLVARVAAEAPELDRFGIHVMLSQNHLGEAVLGDSHEYDAEIEPFDKAEIDRLMLRELRKIVVLPSWEIAARWHGIYLKHTAGPWFEADPLPGVKIVTGFGGAGMTMSFGAAERVLKGWGRP